MPWTTPWDFVVGAILTAAQLNTHLRDNTRYLKGLDGVVTTQAGLIVDNSLGTEYLKFPSLTTTQRTTLTPANGMLVYDSTLNIFYVYENSAWVARSDIAKMVIASQAQGDTFYASSSTAIARLGVGTAGHYLKTQGAAANPIWANPPAGNLCLTLTPTATGWNTAPTTLTNLTDGSLASVTGEGEQSVGDETNDYGEVTIDLGSNMALLHIFAKIGIRRTGAVAVTARLRAGELDNLSDVQIGTDVTSSSETEEIFYIRGVPASTTALIRYISLRMWGYEGGYYHYLKVYEIVATGLPLT